MKNKMIGLTLLVFLMSGSLVFADKTKSTEGYREMLILDKGVKRTLKIKETEDKTPSVNTLGTEKEVSSAKTTKEGVIIAFKHASHADIAAFETKYGLKLKKKLVTGYYIFNNPSEKDDAEVIQNIITNEKNVKTVKPNWKKQNLPR